MDFNFPHNIVSQLVALLATFLKARLNKDVSKRQQTRVQDELIWIRKSQIFMEVMMPAKVV